MNSNPLKSTGLTSTLNLFVPQLALHPLFQRERRNSFQEFQPNAFTAWKPEGYPDQGYVDQTLSP